jgi:hypothetical protein
LLRAAPLPSSPGAAAGLLSELRALLRNTQDAQLYLPAPGSASAWDAAQRRIGLGD